MCLFRCRGVTVPRRSSTVIRLSARWPAHACSPAANDARSLEAHVVLRVGVGDVDLAAHRVDGHVEEDGADAGETDRPATSTGGSRRRRSRRRPCRAARSGRRCPSRGRARPPSGVPSNLTIRPASGRRCPRKLVFGAGRPPGAARPPCMAQGGGAQAPPSQTSAFGDRRRAVAGVEDRRVDGAARPALTASARGVSPKSVTIVSACRRAWRRGCVGVEHPDVGAADAAACVEDGRGSFALRGVFWPRCAW